MAEETTDEEVASHDLDSPDTKVLYANNTYIAINDTDVEIFFGFKPDRVQKKPYVFDQKIVINHSAFMKMIQFWAKRYRVLNEVYGADLPGLRDYDPAELQDAYTRVFGNDEDSAQNDDEIIQDAEDDDMNEKL